MGTPSIAGIDLNEMPSEMDDLSSGMGVSGLAAMSGATLAAMFRAFGAKGTIHPPKKQIVPEGNKTMLSGPEHEEGTAKRKSALMSMTNGTSYWDAQKNGVDWTSKRTGTKVRNDPKPDGVIIPPLQNFTQHGRDEEKHFGWRHFKWSRDPDPDPDPEPEPDPVVEIKRRVDPSPVVQGGGGGGGGGGVVDDCSWIPMIVAATATTYALNLR